MVAQVRRTLSEAKRELKVSNRSDEDDEVPRNQFRVTKRRIGTIRFIREDGEYGFIRGEDFRDDVFFHHTTWEGGPGKPPAADMVVEFELDDEHLKSENRLRASAVRPTSRPEGKRLSGKDAPHLINLHHPNARKKRPSWRNKE